MFEKTLILTLFNVNVRLEKKYTKEWKTSKQKHNFKFSFSIKSGFKNICIYTSKN